MIYFEKTASLMYDISTNEAPSLILNQQLFTKARNVHGYCTRSATRGNYYVKSSRLEIQKTCFRVPALVFATAYIQNYVISINVGLKRNYVCLFLIFYNLKMNILVYLNLLRGCLKLNLLFDFQHDNL